MLIPAMPGTRTSRLSWSPANTAPNSARNSSGRTKLKNAALGLRQNIRRSRRYWRHASPSSAIAGLRSGGGRPSGGGGVLGQVEVDVLERRARDGQVAQRLAARQRRGRQLVQQAGRVLGLAGDD